MKRMWTALCGVVLCCAITSIAQTPPPMPKPGPEHKNLGYFAGTWNVSGDVKAGAMGPGGKYTGTERNEWMPGGFFLVSHNTGSGPMGKETGLAVYGYDAEKKTYTYDEFNNAGEALHATGTYDGKVWTWTADSMMGGKPVKGRFIATETSPTSYTFKFEMSQDGSNFATVMEGTGKKAGSAGAATKKKQ